MAGPTDPEGFDPKEIWQRIKSENQWETDLELEPAMVPWIFVSNLITRTLSRLIAQGPYGPVTVRATKEGNLAVVTRGGAFDDYELIEHPFAAANESTELEFAQQVERIDLFTYDGRCDYGLTRDLVKDYGDKIELFSDSFYSLDFYTRRVEVTAKTFAPKEDGTNTTATADKLIDSAATFTTNNVAIADVVANITQNKYASVTAVDSETQLSLSADIFPVAQGTGKSYSVEGTRCKLMGWFREAG